jgi:signal peptidase I
VNGREFIVSTVPTAVTANFEGGFTKEGVPVTVPQDSIFVLGDNRMRSADSRDFGFIKKANIKGVFQFCYSNCQ